MAQK
jgi:hypothetical protein